MLEIRPYQTLDLEHVLSLFQKNVPEYFAPEEKTKLVDYLQTEKEDYFLMMIRNKLIGCGGINYFPKDHAARIAWDFFDPEFQGKGYGRQLLEYRIDYIRQQKAFKTVFVKTSQLAHLFYEKSGFNLKFVKENYWAPGLHLYYMELILSA